MFKMLMREARCRNCDARVAAPGTGIRQLAMDRFADMDPDTPFEIVLNGKPAAVIRCSECGTKTSLDVIAGAFVVRPWTHLCGCGCEFTVHATRNVAVPYFGSAAASQ